MINQQELDEIVYQELKSFNLSIGWIDPDFCDMYEEYDSNDELLHFEISDLMFARFEKDTHSDDKSIDLYNNILLHVEEHEPYEDWVNFSHEFKLPNLLCIQDVETFTEAFKESIVCSYKEMKLKAISDKIRLPNDLPEEQLESMFDAENVTISFSLKDWSYEVLEIK